MGERIERGNWDGKLEQMRLLAYDAKQCISNSADRLELLSQKVSDHDQIHEEHHARLLQLRGTALHSRPMEHWDCRITECESRIESIAEELKAAREEAEMPPRINEMIEQLADEAPKLSQTVALIEKTCEPCVVSAGQEQLADVVPELVAHEALSPGSFVQIRGVSESEAEKMCKQCQGCNGWNPSKRALLGSAGIIKSVSKEGWWCEVHTPDGQDWWTWPFEMLEKGSISELQASHAHVNVKEALLQEEARTSLKEEAAKSSKETADEACETIPVLGQEQLMEQVTKFVAHNVEDEAGVSNHGTEACEE